MPEAVEQTNLPELDPVVHGKLRLAVLSLLAGVEEAEFTWLRTKTGSTDGNLGAQLMKLEEAGDVAGEEKFGRRKPQSLYRMTGGGPGGVRRPAPGGAGRRACSGDRPDNCKQDRADSGLRRIACS